MHLVVAGHDHPGGRPGDGGVAEPIASHVLDDARDHCRRQSLGQLGDGRRLGSLRHRSIDTHHVFGPHHQVQRWPQRGGGDDLALENGIGIGLVGAQAAPTTALDGGHTDRPWWPSPRPVGTEAARGHHRHHRHQHARGRRLWSRPPGAGVANAVATGLSAFVASGYHRPRHHGHRGGGRRGGAGEENGTPDAGDRGQRPGGLAQRNPAERQTAEGNMAPDPFRQRQRRRQAEQDAHRSPGSDRGAGRGHEQHRKQHQGDVAGDAEFGDPPQPDRELAESGGGAESRPLPPRPAMEAGRQAG